MKATLTRTLQGDQGTFGTLVLEGGFFCYTAELPWRDNRPNMSRIPAGAYTCSTRFSWRFLSTLYEVKDVPDRDSVLLHRGNYAGDTKKGFKTDVQGCILLGQAVGSLYRDDDRLQKAVIGSKAALAAFMEATKGEAIELTILEEFKEGVA